MINSASVRHLNYIEHDEIRRVIPANLCAGGVDPSLAEHYVNKFPARPLYDNEKCFDANTEKLVALLPSPREYLVHHCRPTGLKTAPNCAIGGPEAAPETAPKRAIGTFACLIDGCSAKFGDIGDLLAHLPACANNDLVHGFSCQACGVSTSKGADADGNPGQWAQTASKRARHHVENCHEWKGLLESGIRIKKRKAATKGPNADFAMVACRGCRRSYANVGRLHHHWRHLRSCQLSDAYGGPVGAVAQAHEQKLQLLAEYKEEHSGDANIPAKGEYKGVKLGNWLRNTKASTTNPNRTSPEPWILECLRDLGVKWACNAVAETATL
jgi:hypothetical protein